jgi:1-deoxy-D-xylulose-5-phosphate reductoisomerase
MEKFPCLRLAYEAGKLGGGKTVALNAADEVAVSAFLEGTIGFEQIPLIIEEIVTETPLGRLESIRQVLEVDERARAGARKKVAGVGREFRKAPAGVGTPEH